MRFDENPSTCQCEKETEKASGFQISHFYWSFSSNTMAAKGLSVFEGHSIAGRMLHQHRPGLPKQTSADCRVAAGQERVMMVIYRSRIQRGACRGDF